MLNTDFGATISAIGQAIAYSLTKWDKLMVYVDEAHLQIDNNLIENTIRPVGKERNICLQTTYKTSESLVI